MANIISIIALLLVIVLLNGVAIFLLWNWLMPIVFGLPVLTFWQSIGMSLLAQALFKSTSSK
jgi:hypothetical protein